MIATSIGGGITGKGGNRIVVDDPHNPTQAVSDVQRETALTYYSQSLATRLDNKATGAIVVVMQRLHERDLSALCQDHGFTHVCLPAEAESPRRWVFPCSGRVHEQAAGDLLWPERDSPAVLAEQKRLLGSAGYSGQYQQRPAPAGGLIFQRSWFKFYDDVPPLSTWVQSWDMTYKNGASNDYVVGLVGGWTGADIYLVDRVKGQWDFRESCRQVKALKVKYPQTAKIYIEDAANGPAIINMLGREVQGIIGVKPEGGKEARAQAAQPLAEAGNIWLPNPRPHGRLIPARAWVDDFLDQCCAFPTGAHDDDVDAFSQLVAQWLQPQLIPRVRCFDLDLPIPAYTLPWHRGDSGL
jgi:predicted phage terminase large subunit-like protein